eukprot:CAMPEP_0174357278 /NCGR_PEP_ID=MMETSP0811_2-20130205/35073_1 /TAXON_ID=73025 ORGANISM="Eutreptiella gymnastica-like, Strain CCMP1594" /NCGR_SAMPLE_ID=MMETSP0811_2 /ASSEMBLY_ACC=CAM_ASM_000667 /LENGTH=191 /DNA_ID=CAMNT_0015489953 /DNA_START=1051 /DNA_END=1624 /DNA_ORIENTATION=+
MLRMGSFCCEMLALSRGLHLHAPARCPQEEGTEADIQEAAKQQGSEFGSCQPLEATSARKAHPRGRDKGKARIEGQVGNKQREWAGPKIGGCQPLQPAYYMEYNTHDMGKGKGGEVVVTRVGKDGCRYGPQGKEQMLCQNSDALMWNLISGHHQLILCVLQHYARTCIHSRTYSFTRDHTFTRACNGPIRK